MPSTIAQTLNAIWLLLFTSKSRSLTQPERDELERLCSVLSESLPARLVCGNELSEFAVRVRYSGLVENGQTKDLGFLLEIAESLKPLVG